MNPRMGVQHQEKVVRIQEEVHWWRKVRCENDECELVRNGVPLVLTRHGEEKRKVKLLLLLFSEKDKRLAVQSIRWLRERTARTFLRLVANYRWGCLSEVTLIKRLRTRPRLEDVLYPKRKRVVQYNQSLSPVRSVPYPLHLERVFALQFDLKSR